MNQNLSNWLYESKKFIFFLIKIILFFSLNDVDCLLLHLHLFNSEKQYYTLPDEFDHSTPFFEYCKSVEKPVLNSKYEYILIF